MNGDAITMERYVARVIVELKRELERGLENVPVPPTAAEVDAARAAIRAFNTELVELAPGPIEPGRAVALTIRRDWSLYALTQHGGTAFAKREQLALASSNPLAVCTGGGPPVFGDTVLGVVPVSTKGCFRIFEEPLNVAGKKWSRLCPDCQPRNGRRQPYREARAAASRRAAEIAAIRAYNGSISITP